MSASGAPAVKVSAGAGLRVAVVAAQWHAEVIDGLLDGVSRALDDAGVTAP